MGLFDLFGNKEFTRSDDFFGELRTGKLSRKDQKQPFVWYGSYQLEGFLEDTEISFVGNELGVSPNMLDIAHEFITNWSSKYRPELRILISSNKDFELFTDWETEFILSGIFGVEDDKLEVSFDPYDYADESWFMFDVEHGQITNLDGE